MERVINRKSEEFQSIVQSIQQAMLTIDKLSEQRKITLDNEHYLSGQELCEKLHISKRSLQEYRDSRILPYTSIGGKLLYP